jgi:hypothetical protein
MSDARLMRFAYTPNGTFGRLVVGGKEFYTVERPWKDNQSNVSCIPEGRYTLRMRDSGVVTRSTGGAYSRGWEVTNVKGRSFIMIHPGNTVDDLQGCIAPGKQLGVVNGKWAVASSRPAFDELMSILAGQDEWNLTIDFSNGYAG